jgi:hypothetical protein
MEMNKIQTATYRLAQACDGNPIESTIVVMLFYVGFQVIELSIEKLIFGGPFVHFIDPLSAMAFMAYAAYSVYWCAVFNGVNK